MKIRTKTLIIVAATSIGLFVALYASARLIVFDGFSEVEETAVRDNVHRVEDAILAEAESLNITAGDWALWDDTYQFAQDGNQEYIDANLSALTLTNLDIHFMVFVDASGDVTYASGADLETGEEVVLDDASLSAIASTDALYGHTGPDSAASGVIALPDGPALVASRPIMTSAQEGPIMGAFVIGRYMDDSFVAAIQDTTNISLSLAEPSQAQDVGLGSEPPGNIAVEPVDSSTIDGYSVVSDVAGNPVLLLQVSMPRDIHSQAVTTDLYLIGALVFAALVFTVVVLLVLERAVLAPLSALSAAVSRIGIENNQAIRVPAAGRDEVGLLGAEINSMLGSIEEFNHSLEEKIRERTVDLELAIAELRDRNRQLIEARSQAATDGLTSLPNHRTFQEAVRKLVPNAEESSVSLIMLDIDSFKMANDTLGHQAGDEILRSCARILQRGANGHYVYRYGGDEFAVVVAGAGLDEAEHVAELLRNAVLSDAGVASRHVTISLGVSSYPDTAGSAEELIYEADAAMYAAKLSGKNRTCRWDQMARVAADMNKRRSAPVTRN